jgi:hypothetical protein
VPHISLLRCGILLYSRAISGSQPGLLVPPGAYLLGLETRNPCPSANTKIRITPGYAVT